MKFYERLKTYEKRFLAFYFWNFLVPAVLPNKSRFIFNSL
jgi:hypothetical protein